MEPVVNPPRLWVVRALGGERADEFREHGYAGVGFDLTVDLSRSNKIEEVEKAWREAHPTRRRKTNAVDQTHWFLNEIKPGDQIITPAREGKLYIGTVQGRGKRREVPSPAARRRRRPAQLSPH